MLGIIAQVDRQFGSRVAERVLDRIETALLRLAEHPGLGRSREDLTTDARLRFWNVGPTLIAYRQGATAVEIILIERGERDWARLLDPHPTEI